MNILLIAPRFYEFDAEIHSVINQAGHECELHVEKPYYNNGMVQKIIQKLPSKIYALFVDAYIEKIFQTKINPNIIIIIRGEHWDPSHLIKLKKYFKNVRCIMYQWDSSGNLPLFKSQLKFFDKVYTFDSVDANQFEIEFKPLFYKERWRNNLSRQSSVAIKHKVAFVGTDHTDRYDFIDNFKRLNDFSESDFYCHLFRSRWSFYFNKYIKRDSKFKYMTYDYRPTPLGESDSINVFLCSHSILDVNPPEQVGLSARTFEALALNKKLITTNGNIAKYDFFDPRNILVVDRCNPVIPDEFFSTPYISPPEVILQKYTSSYWVKDFLK